MKWKPPQKAKRDANEPLIIAALKAHGFTVETLDQPVDLAITRRGQTWLAEVKNPDGKNKSTAKQDQFIARWPVAVPIFRTVEDVRAWASDGRVTIEGVNDDPH